MTTGDKHLRETIRLAGFDYRTAGAYFVTICAHERGCFFGGMEDDKVALSQVGSIVRDEWMAIEGHYRNVRTGDFVVMPNHIHGII